MRYYLEVLNQYLGVIVNGVQPNSLIGAYRFPRDQSLTEWKVAGLTGRFRAGAQG
jgi:hypothetical protein